MKKPEMPNVRVRTNPNGSKVYFIDYWNPWKNKRVRETVGSRKKEAQIHAGKVYAFLKSKWLGEDDYESVDFSLEELVNEFIQSKIGSVKDRTIKRYNILANHLVTFFKSKLPAVQHVREITKPHFDVHLNELRQNGQATKTLNAQIQFIKSLFIYAVDQGYCRTSPVKDLKKLVVETESQEVRYWTAAEMNLILDNEVLAKVFLKNLAFGLD